MPNLNPTETLDWAFWSTLVIGLSKAFGTNQTKAQLSASGVWDSLLCSGPKMALAQPSNWLKNNCDRWQDIMKLFDILLKVPFARSKAIHDISYKKHCIRVSSRISKQLKTWEIWKYLKNLKNKRNKTLVIAVKNYVKVDIKLFSSCRILLDFFTLLQIFCPEI